MSAYLVACLVALRSEVDEAYPNRDKASDGWIGDAAHSARESQHNPDDDSLPPGAVRAIDVDSNGAPTEVTPLVAQLLKATIGDPRVYYVIFNRKIYSRTYGWAPRVYTGSNPHDHHVHVSVRGIADGLTEAQAKVANADTRPWFEDKPPARVLPAVRLHRVLEASRHPRKEWAPANVRRVQRALRANRLYVPITGRYDHDTRVAVQRFQQRLGYRGADADGLLGVRSGTQLGANRYRLLP